MAKKPPPQPAAPTLPKPKGLIEQTGNRPGGTVAKSYKYDKNTENKSKDK